MHLNKNALVFFIILSVLLIIGTFPGTSSIGAGELAGEFSKELTEGTEEKSKD